MVMNEATRGATKVPADYIAVTEFVKGTDIDLNELVASIQSGFHPGSLIEGEWYILSSKERATTTDVSPRKNPHCLVFFGWVILTLGALFSF